MNTMHFLRRSFQNSAGQCHHHQRRTLYDATSSIKPVRDRGLDHVVEREKNLKPVWNIKNFIKSEPSKSLPLNLIIQSKECLEIPTRPIEFIRKYPAIFQEFFPASINIHPHIKLTPDVLNLDSEEQLLYECVSYQENVANRLLRLLMIGKTNKIPLSVIDRLKWDLGLPHDYAKMIVPEFPDYFRVSNSGDAAMLELVCWSHEIAISEMEKRAVKGGNEGVPINFSLKYSNGFEMDKKYKKWVDEWQKLPYISPYKNAMHLPSQSDKSDKLAVGILHEVLNLCVGKKAEKDNVLFLGEYLGLRSRFKRALLQHQGIFYISSKIGTHTVVLKEAYKRGGLFDKCPMMEMRFRYVRLLNTVTEDKKSEKTGHDTKESKSKKFDDEDGEECEDFNSDHSDSETEEESNEDKKAKSGGKLSFNKKFEENPSRSMPRRLTRSNSTWNEQRSSPRSSRRIETHHDIQEDKESKNGRRLNFSAKFEGKKALRAAPMKKIRSEHGNNFT